jgi:hypothetical protein
MPAIATNAKIGQGKSVARIAIKTTPISLVDAKARHSAAISPMGTIDIDYSYRKIVMARTAGKFDAGKLEGKTVCDWPQEVIDGVTIRFTQKNIQP